MTRTPSTKAALAPQMETVLARLCELLGRLSKTQAVKLPYLVDVIAKHELGRPIARGRYQCWRHGVVAEDVFRNIDSSSAFRTREERFSEYGMWIEAAKPASRMKPEEESIIEYVANRFGKLDQNALGVLTKRMNTHIPIDKWGSNAKAEINETAYERMSQQWQQVCEELTKVDYARLDEGAVEINSDDDLLRLVS